jgi:CheY-like chemotaxis protein
MSKNILVVDDEQDVRDYLGALLQDNGYGVLTAADGAQAMERVKRRRPDLILLDLDMPEETGTGFYRKLRNRKDLRQIPVIVVSGLAGRHVAISRSVVVLDKPLDERRLLDEVESALLGQQRSA